jgi:hypothetical protein
MRGLLLTLVTTFVVGAVSAARQVRLAGGGKNTFFL